MRWLTSNDRNGAISYWIFTNKISSFRLLQDLSISFKIGLKMTSNEAQNDLITIVRIRTIASWSKAVTRSIVKELVLCHVTSTRTCTSMHYLISTQVNMFSLEEERNSKWFSFTNTTCILLSREIEKTHETTFSKLESPDRGNGPIPG